MVHQRSLRSLRANFDKIEVYIDSFNNYFDIVAISETWLDNDDVKSLYNLPGYDTFFVNSFNTRPPGRGGVMATSCCTDPPPGPGGHFMLPF